MSTGNCRNKLTRGRYVSDRSDLLVFIVSVYYQNDVYAKVKYELYNKHNGIFYQKKSAKLIKSRIQHWRRERYDT